MSQTVADIGIVSSNHSPRRSSPGAPDWGKRSSILIQRCRRKAAAEAFEVGSVEFSPKFTCNNREFGIYCLNFWRECAWCSGGCWN